MAEAPLVLVVDDRASLRLLLTRVLERLGYRVRTAASATESLALAAAEPPAAVICDLRLPDSPGEGLIAALRARVGPATRFLVLSGADDLEAEARRAGADAWLAKPFDLDELAARLGGLLRTGGAGSLPPATEEASDGD